MGWQLRTLFGLMGSKMFGCLIGFLILFVMVHSLDLVYLSNPMVLPCYAKSECGNQLNHICIPCEIG